jgi:ABC-2 type transport system ATP-binding protein
MTSAAIMIRGLRKRYGSMRVLDGIDLDVPAGTVFSLLGPNGAGKTTAVNILTTLIRADAGEARVAGFDVATQSQAVRAAIGVTGQFSAVDPLLTGVENLTMMGNLAHLPRPVTRRRVGELLERFELTEAAARRTGTYSGGMTRRLDLAMSLIGEPRVLFLDEPTTGLDPRSRRTVWHVIQGLAASGVTVFLTTQYLDEADELADRVALLDRGRIVADGTPDELKRLVPGGHVSVQFTDPDGLDAAARALGDVAGDPDTLTLQIPSDGSVASLRALLDRFDDHSIAVAKLSIHTPDLDDVFFALTGRTAEAAPASPAPDSAGIDEKASTP